MTPLQDICNGVILVYGLGWSQIKKENIINTQATETDTTPASFFDSYDEICEMIQAIVAQRILHEIVFCKIRDAETWVFSEYDLPLGTTVEEKIDISTCCTQRVSFETEDAAWEFYHERVAENHTAHWG